MLAAAAYAMPVSAQETALPADPVPVIDGVALVSAQTAEATPSARRLARFRFPAADDTPVLGDQIESNGHRLLKRLYAEGAAAGNWGDLYDNRDADHSRLPAENHPQLSHVSYDDAARQAGLNYGLQGEYLFDAPTIGNSSAAVDDGRFWRSLPRLALTIGEGADPIDLYRNYVSGQIHVYPEHRDHDAEHGDLLPANTPFYLISQGSSGSDQPHVEALAIILAAFRPGTKAFLRESGLIAPTVQMIFRRGQTDVPDRATYLSGVAHPTVFPAGKIDLGRMVALANALSPGTVPPMVRLHMVSEERATEGVDYFGAGLSETLFDTPTAIARIWRSFRHSRSMIVSAETTRDPNGRPLSFTWAVLRGDPARIRIEPMRANGSRARITIEWQDPQPVAGFPGIMSNRIDIGIFASNGFHDSAPAFVSVLLPQHETRRYEPGPGGMMRIAEIDRSAREGGYVDPALFPHTPWRDEYTYAPDGHLTGWRRWRGRSATHYSASGARIVAVDVEGQPSKLEDVRYVPVVSDSGMLTIEERAPNGQ